MNTFLLLLLSQLSFASTYGTKPEATEKCQKGKPIQTDVVITKVIDGDTAHVKTNNGNYSVRLMGIDTPESYFMGQSQGEWAEKATIRTKELLPSNTPVRLEIKGEGCDSHGRVLAYIFKKKMNINLVLAEEGLAVNYCVAPTFDYCQEIGEATKQAIQNRVGMFSDSNAELPYDFRRRIGGNKQRSYVGNWTTKEVLKPGNQDSIPVGERVFFYHENMIQPPFRLVD